MNSCSIMIVGVGGQGTLLASRVLGKLALGLGLDVKLSEVHGMAQRGGSVVTYVKMANKVNSPIIAESEADFILAFEKLEALRYAHFLCKNGTLIVNNEEIAPIPVITGAAKYPDDIMEKLSARDIKIVSVNALELALSCGNSKATNTVMLGVLAKHLGIDKDYFLKILSETVPQKFLDLNLAAGEKGYEL